MPFPPFEYRLAVGERFTIEGHAARRVRFVGGATLQDLKIKFLLECVVRDVSAPLCTIDAVFRDVDVEGRPARPFKRAVGDSFRVVKRLTGPICYVEGGEKTRAALGGVSVAEGLTWYGARFPEHSIVAGEEWREEFTLGIGAEFFGLPDVGHSHPVAVQRHYRADGWESFQDLRCPRWNQTLTFRGDSVVGPFRLRSTGTGTDGRQPTTHAASAPFRGRAGASTNLACRVGAPEETRHLRPAE